MFGSNLSGLLTLLGILLVSPVIIALWAFFRTTDNRQRTDIVEKRLKKLASEVDRLNLYQEKILEQLADQPKQPDDAKETEENIETETETPSDQEPDQEKDVVPDDIEEWNKQHPEKSDEPAHTPSSVPTGLQTPASIAQGGTPAPGKQSIEQAMGAQWSVWLGGLALALGAIFMVKHSIDQGYLTPAVRIFFSVLMSGALLAGGEWMRRRDVLSDIGGLPGAYIPGALTAAGVVAAFATVYASYGLYHFIGPTFAFILLALVALGALGSSIIHGPGLAAMGLAGAYITPALVSTDNPSAWTLFTYLLFVSAANFLAAQMRSWLWLAVSAVVASTLWGLVWFVGPWKPTDALPLSLYILGLLLLALPFLKQGEPQLDDKQRASLFASTNAADWPVTLALAAIAFLSVFLLRYADYSSLAMSVFALVTGLFFVSAWRWFSLAFLTVAGAALFLLSYAGWHIPDFTNVLGQTWSVHGRRGGQLALDAVTPPQLIAFLTYGGLFATGIALTCFMLVRRTRGEPLFALVSTLTPLAAFVYAYWRVTDFDPSISFGLIGLALAAAATLATDRLDREGANHQEFARRHEVSAGVFATAAVAALALACTIMLEKGWLTIALAVMTPALALIARKRDMKVLGYLAGAMALLVAARLFWEPRIVGDLRGTLPLFNWLLYGYGVPALAMALAASIFRKDRDDFVPDLLEAAAILFTTVLIFLQIRHAMNDGNIYASRFNLVENGLQTSVWVALSLGMHKMHRATGRMVPEFAANILGLIGMATALFGLLLLNNPLFSSRSVGKALVFNDLLLGYLIPALLFLFLFWKIAGERKKYYVMTAGFGAFALTFTWLSLELRHWFQGSRLDLFRHTSDPEWYAYSALWLLFALALLLIGILLRQQQIRLASLGLIGLVIAKVFLSDMNNLTGIWRAFSFIGLGLALVGTGWLYQRIIIPQGDEGENRDDGVDGAEEEPDRL